MCSKIAATYNAFHLFYCIQNNDWQRIVLSFPTLNNCCKYLASHEVDLQNIHQLFFEKPVSGAFDACTELFELYGGPKHFRFKLNNKVK